MNNLSKDQQQQKAGICAELCAAYDEAVGVLNDVNGMLDDLKGGKCDEATVRVALLTAKGACAAYISLCEEASDFAGEVRDEIDECRAGKSEKWQESEKGEAFQAWSEAWDEVAQMDGPDLPSFPDEGAALSDLSEVEEIDNCFVEMFEQLPDSVEDVS